MVTGVAGGTGVPVNNMSPPEKKQPGDNRRSNKPIMEKRRRARINNCLNELKALILDAMKKDPARHSKLEKADILEMTVKHLEGLRSEGAGSPDRFRAGYRHCVSEVAKFQGLEAGLKRRLVRHLEGCVTSAPGARPAGAPTPPSDTEDPPSTQHSTIFISGPGSGVRLVPTRLSNGDIALVLPAGVSANTLGTVPTLVPLSPRDASSSSASSEARCFSPASSGWGTPPPPSEDPAPLALVTRKQPPEDKPWRPW
ncbi:protein hairy isoform X2 [Pectinophora gossypiella]|uniref:protein hairy isoform X2 n=1 Tax=Pectinophora gossypiella TaxID=13191 RepID=UPI00214E2CC2|nr:protein hairy isoform X2 [Pectinophora gossypiella]